MLTNGQEGLGLIEIKYLTSNTGHLTLKKALPPWKGP